MTLKCTVCGSRSAPMDTDTICWGCALQMARTEIEQLKEELKEKDTPADDALSEIVKLCGCETWDYPGQVVRDVQMLKEKLMSAETDVEGYHHTINDIAKLLGCNLEPNHTLISRIMEEINYKIES